MPSRATQRVVIVKNKKPRKPGTYLLIAAKTGFMDVTIGNQRFYYNYKETSNNGSVPSMKKAVNNQAQKSKKKKIIVIRKR